MPYHRFLQTIHRSPWAENLPPCESVRFASIWTHITASIFVSSSSSDFSDYPFKIEYLKNSFFITFLIEKWPIWAVSSAGSAKGSVFCHTCNFILLYSSVPLLELLIWARSSVWESVRFASVRSRVRSPSGPPHSGDLVLRSPEFFHAFRMHDSTHSCPLPDVGSRRTV